MNDPELGDRIVGGIARFGRTLHSAGLEIGPSRIQDAARALTAIDLRSRREVYWALRCTLVSRQSDFEAFDRAFAGLQPPDSMAANAALDLKRESMAEAVIPDLARAVERQEVGDTDRGGDEEEFEVGMRWSAVERLRELDFAQYTDSELALASGLVEQLARAVPLRRSRRLRIAKSGPVFDKRRTLRRAMRTDGYVLTRLWREPRLVPRSLVFAVDVSGSMQPYARAMLMFMQAAVRAGRTVEAFTFGTRLTRVTPDLAQRDWNRALEAATRSVRDWAGGTRIGESLKALSDEWGRRGVTRGAVVVIVSDGWECGDVAGLVREMERLQRVSHTIVWVNPLASRPGYEPLSQGMAASLPYVDRFLPGHNLLAIEELAAVLESAADVRRGVRARNSRHRSP